MRILHTADWHIGQRLYDRPRLDEHQAFLDWLLDAIQTLQIDILLVSGDIFDTSLPAADATKLYYKFLYDLFNETNTYTVITAGNHDSARHLEAPKEFLQMGRIYVVGIANDPSDCVFTFPKDAPQVAVAAVPYLSESDLQHLSYETEGERIERYRSWLKQFYADCAARMPAELPKILMGHLYVQGGDEVGSERNIQIGGATAVRANDFPEGVDYVALGHLHRPQEISGGSCPIRYSGSPIPLKFNEAVYRKKAYLLELSDGKIVRDEAVEIPTFKELCIVEGGKAEVLMQAGSGGWDGKYIRVKLKSDDAGIGVSDQIRQAFSARGGDVLAVEIDRPKAAGGARVFVEDMKRPEEIFVQYCRENYGGEPDETLLRTFRELLQIVEETE